MERLLFLFIIGAIGMTLRFVILGKFEWNQVLTLFLFPIGAIVVWFIHRWMIERDSNYKPKQIDENWNTYLGERYSTGKKLLYKGTQRKGEYHRFYQHWWQHLFNEVIEGGGKWYMNLSFELQGGDKIKFIEQKKKKLRFNETWHIVQHDQIIGKVKTDYSMKNAAKLQEGLTLEMNDKVYYFKSFGIGSETEVLLDNKVIAKGKRSDSLRYKYHFEITEGYEELEPTLMMTYILFNYVHKQ
ncbi:MAG TPA: hypothetical protein VNM45_06075 [Bacillus sp. (in: firmicutes)]|nr:hypothetical protein [Bacillus sp. (in: firmicutes)]